MEDVIKLLNCSIDNLNELEREIKGLNEKELETVASAYPFNHHFLEMIDSLSKWKREIEKVNTN
ncbi:hypothetical protein ACFPU1_09050 [Thalassorhabdus alkalitolerans]|uniref:Uncharacterized protein n=1 Tax=Thalassorhabdus alkalitolerans TaxID=2282697 RepID=A0ABW0YP57_9BACI|nr:MULTISPECIES: hypothetical protein [Bacillaceae]